MTKTERSVLHASLESVCRELAAATKRVRSVSFRTFNSTGLLLCGCCEGVVWVYAPRPGVSWTELKTARLHVRRLRAEKASLMATLGFGTVSVSNLGGCK